MTVSPFDDAIPPSRMCSFITAQAESSLPQSVVVSSLSSKPVATGTAVLSGGTATVLNAAVDGSSVIVLTHAGTNVSHAGTLYLGAVTTGVGFIIDSTNALDVDTVNYAIIG